MASNKREGTPLWDQKRTERDDGRAINPNRPPRNMPCDKRHEMCGCSLTGFGCCLDCPLPVCVYDEIDAGKRVRLSRGRTIHVDRGPRIAQLLEQGKTPREIRAEMGLSRVQYIRALQKHRATGGLPVCRATVARGQGSI